MATGDMGGRPTARVGPPCTRPCGPVGPTPTGHSRHGAPCLFGRYWSFGLLVLGGCREVTSLQHAASTEATAERKAYLAQAFLQNNLWCRVYMLLFALPCNPAESRDPVNKYYDRI